MRTPRSSNLDFGVLAAVLGLLVIGLPMIYSASHITDGTGKLLRQAIWAGVGLLGMGGCLAVDYRQWSRFRRLFYVLTTLALAITLIAAGTINGARSWIDLGAFRLQPSEFAKLAMILVLAAVLARAGTRLRTLPVFLRSLLLCGVPILLVLAQPDFGTAMVLCSIWFVMVWLAGARWWMLLGVCLLAMGLFSVAWRYNLIKNYQKARLDFIHADPAGSGYHQSQARIAIGAGGLWGKGYLRGTQARRGFLPEAETDFIYAVIGEELGLLGCLAVLGLYLYAFSRLLTLAEEADTAFGRLVVAGVTAMWAVHLLINVGMCLTLMPVTGIPLPFLSYGGSNLLTNLLALGIVLNISRTRQTRREWASTPELVQV